MDLISIIVPCKNEQEVLPLFYEKTKEVFSQINGSDYEIIIVDDGSDDETLNITKKLCQNDKHIRFVSLSRNFGKEGAMFAGLSCAKGNFIGVMDADLQDPPELVPEMYQELQKGEFDCVASRRVTRKGEPPIRSFFAWTFYRIINKISDADIVDGARDFRLMTRKMCDSILSLQEYNRFSKGIFGWVGFKTKWLEYENRERAAGETKWSFWKLFFYSLEGITAFSVAPLAISSVMGLVFCALSFVLLLYFLFKTIMFGDPVDGFPALICTILMVSGIQLFSIGILGQYLSKTYLETKRRPIFIVRETEEDV